MTAPIQVTHLFPVLDHLLLDLLKDLSPEDWQKQTIARLWTVKDVAAHLLDGNIRTLSIQRDRYFGDQPPAIQSYTELVGWLNQLNADWVTASKRMSTEVLIMLLEITGKQVNAYYASLEPTAKAIFPVAWAGEKESENWFHVAREYTEKWHHQQQIREAVGQQALLTRELFYPLADTFLRGLPHALRHTEAATGTVVGCHVSSEIGGTWYARRTNTGWHLTTVEPTDEPAAIVAISPETAWKLFTKGISPAEAKQQAQITGNTDFAEAILQMIAVMA
ncbi:maleylpyruvate isomerase N-terminal domain-containing protein [Pontibacter sp. 13R65]|uniref:maleylpyruvate isomerase N-terminal domain-containing protein n=1 Tax=Pontibacter sp. 13R65 TaxID=3127458 RepID=UPI00301CB7ED